MTDNVRKAQDGPPNGPLSASPYASPHASLLEAIHDIDGIERIRYLLSIPGLLSPGVLRLDLLSSERAMSLYERFPHTQIPGFRIYPDESLLPPGAR